MLTTSVVISTYNRPQGIHALLTSLNSQTVLPQTVIIVDQSKKEAIKAAIDSFRSRPENRLNIQHEQVQFQGLTKSRNHGMDLVKTPITTFIDDDVEIGKEYIERTLAFFEEKRGVVVSGLIQMPDMPELGAPKPGGLWQLYRTIFGLSRYGKGWKVLPNFEVIYTTGIKTPTEAEYISGSNFSIYSDIAKKVRFDEKLVWYSIGEDIDFPQRVRREHPHGVWFDPRLPVSHPHAPEGALSEFLLTVHTCHHYYLYSKQWEHHPPAFAKIMFAWGRVGAVLMPCLQARKAKVIPNLDLLARALRVELKVLKHATQVFKGDFPIKT